MPDAEPKFEDRRFDPDLTPFHDLAKQLAGAFGYTADLDLDGKLAQLLRLRVAQLNTCSYCLILHSKAARDQDIETAKIDNLASWWESDLYSPPERAALAYCDALTAGKGRDFQPVHDEVAEHFSQKEIAEMAAIVINMNLWTRLKLAQGATPVFER
ncbi:carboxymuconolactone decarboxylase family protein [Altererythrobacter arenosus]|uniref:Carboxymuconolactone decarboxylase family protein n=1 Tax=Altererythrobacter arenosus TaxID=3032592 RepID=A0ABY8FW05_9SPHN|nr:carboxymuconolactone decarboxylase family protein [Altererythrobacter sp. CAU 1644]WFL78275.1 carboxymuconolactone decarboxylase family protein [Altererythrobacter sp. CAU 1644]